MVLGDSLTAGYGLQAAQAFPEQLEVALQQEGYHVKVINAGVSGDTTAGGLARVDWALSDNPQLVIVELGANDALRGLSVEDTRDNLNSILLRIKQGGAQIVLAGMKAPRNMGEDYVGKFDLIYSDLSRKHKVVLYPFFLSGVALDPLLNQADGIHPNAAGVKVIVSKMLPLIISELNKLR